MMENFLRRKHFVICPLANFYVMQYAGAVQALTGLQTSTHAKSMQNWAVPFDFKYMGWYFTYLTNGNALVIAAPKRCNWMYNVIR